MKIFLSSTALFKSRSRRLGGFLLCLRFILFFVGNYIQTSADDVIISQLQAISQLFSSYLPSELTIHEENGRKWEKCLFGQNWAKIP